MMLTIIMTTIITKQMTISITTITIKVNTITMTKTPTFTDLDKQTYKPVLVRELTGPLWGPEVPRDTSNR